MHDLCGGRESVFDKPFAKKKSRNCSSVQEYKTIIIE